MTLAVRLPHELIVTISVLLTIGGIVGTYVLSIVWRVSAAEQELFGRSYLIPRSWHPRQYTDPPIPESYGAYTYVYSRHGREFKVYKQLINSFQHAYGSALASFELGSVPADLLFRANEYLEAYLEKDGRSVRHYLDTKKDLANNFVGRTIGMECKASGVRGRQAELLIQERVLDAMESGAVINHFADPRVAHLPRLEEYGCPGLPNPAN